MKLSFVIPAFNEQAFIAQTIKSILQAAEGQNCEFEIIVVNNVSADNTRQIAESFPQVKVFDQPKKGTNQARQLGFEKSSGQLICSLDADMRISPAWVKKALDDFQNHPDLVALSGPYVFYDVSVWLRAVTYVFYLLCYPVFVINNRWLKKGGAVMGGNLVIRKNALERIGGYNTALTFYADDSDTGSRLSKVGKVKFDYSFVAGSSGRRLQREGILKSGFRYAINYFWFTFFGKTFHQKPPEA